MRIDHPTTEQIGALRALWQEAFGDDDRFLDAFFDNAFSPLRCRCMTENGRLAAALYWFDCTWQGQKVAYLYAVATAKAFQNRGLCRNLMDDTHALLAAQGYAGAVLVPGTQALFSLYTKLGYTTLSCADTVSSNPGKPVSVRKIDTTEFFALREGFLGQNDIKMGAESCRFLSSVWQLYAGNRWVLAAFDNGEALIGMEFLGDSSAIPGILAALGKKSGTFRIPGSKPFAMYKGFGNDLLPDYFGLAFD